MKKVRICFCGLNFCRTLCALSRQFTVSDIVRDGKNCEITVDSKVLPQVVAFLKERCYNITKIRKIGIYSVLDFFKRHFILPIVFAVAVVALLLSSEFCLKVEVCGDYPSEEVVAALNDCGVYVGSDLFGFSADLLENSLATRLDAMYAVVTRKGSVLYINAVKRKTVEEPVDMHSRRDIIASCGGTVISFLCEQGTPAVKVGDEVKKGDVLIYGLRSFNDGSAEEVYALGKITLQQTATGFAEFVGTVTETVDTGNVFTADSVVLFGKSYGNASPFEHYRTEEHSVSLSPLNLTITRVTYFEVQTVTKQVTVEQCLDKLKADAYNAAVANAEFFVSDVTYKVTEKGVYATVYGKTEIT